MQSQTPSPSVTEAKWSAYLLGLFRDLDMPESASAFVIPPASPGNLGDHLLVSQATTLLKSFNFDVQLVDLHCDLDSNGTQASWSEASLLPTLKGLSRSIEALRSCENTPIIIFLGQDSVDGRYGDYHIRRVLDLKASTRTECTLLTWNATFSPTAELVGAVADLLHQSQMVVRDSQSLMAVEKAGFQGTFLPDLVIASCERFALITNLTKGSDSDRGSVLGVCLGPQCLSLDSNMILEHLRIELALGDSSELQYFEADTRAYSHLPRDLDVAKEIFRDTASVELTTEWKWEWGKDLDGELVRYANHLLQFSSVVTSRQHLSTLCSVLGIPVTCLAYNPKFVGLQGLQGVKLIWIRPAGYPNELVLDERGLQLVQQVDASSDDRNMRELQKWQSRQWQQPPALHSSKSSLWRFKFSTMFSKKQRLSVERREVQWISHILDAGTIHDPEYLGFVNVCAAADVELVLDIGANYGYSATSFRAAGYLGRIWSVEPLNVHIGALRFLRKKWQDSFRFDLIAISDASGFVELVTPVLHGAHLTALTFSKFDSVRLADLLSNIEATSIAQLGVPLEINDLDFVSTRVKCKTMDEHFNNDQWLIEAGDRMAIKIDVEGHEASVLRGGIDLIMRFRPVLMIEGGSRKAEVAEILDLYDYLEIEIEHGRFKPCRDNTSLINGVFMPREKIGIITTANAKQVSCLNLSRCLVCNGEGQEQSKIREDWPPILRCPVCGLLWFAEFPSESSLRAFYESHYDHYLTSTSQQYEKDPGAFSSSARHILSLVTGFVGPPPTSLLEIGSSYPVVGAALRDQGLYVEAVEPNKNARLWGQGQGLVMHSDFETVHRKFDAILASHVMEHLLNPDSFIERAKTFLNPSGVLIVKVPNAASWQSELLQSQWEWAAYPDHLWGFTPLAISQLLTHNGFEILDLKTDLPHAAVESISESGVRLPSVANIERALRGQQIIVVCRLT